MRSARQLGSAIPLVAAATLLGGPPVLAQTAAELRELIEVQRQQIEEQARQLQLLEERLEDLEARTIEVDEPPPPTVLPQPAVAEEARVRSGDTGVSLAISGQINRMLTVGSDGDRTKLYHVDNVNSSSRLRVVGSARPAEAVRVGTNFEFEMRSNASTEVSQTNEDTGTVSFRDRVVEIFAEHERFGRLIIGQGSTAYDGAANVDLSGTTVVGYAGVADLAGGLRFFDDATGALSDTTIGSVFNNFDGPRLDRLRYDSPRVAGFTLSADTAADQRWSTALRWAGAGHGIRAAAAVAYADPGGARDWVAVGSGSLLHEATGLSLTLSAGARDNAGRDNGSNLYAKLGWQADVFTFGRTFTSIDVTRNDDVAVEGDEATSIGLFAVQDIRGWGIELYGGYRWHELDRKGADFDDIHTFSLGSRVRF